MAPVLKLGMTINMLQVVSKKTVTTSMVLLKKSNSLMRLLLGSNKVGPRTAEAPATRATWTARAADSISLPPASAPCGEPGRRAHAHTLPYGATRSSVTRAATGPWQVHQKVPHYHPWAPFSPIHAPIRCPISLKKFSIGFDLLTGVMELVSEKNSNNLNAATEKVMPIKR